MWEISLIRNLEPRSHNAILGRIKQSLFANIFCFSWIFFVWFGTNFVREDFVFVLYITHKAKVLFASQQNYYFCFTKSFQLSTNKNRKEKSDVAICRFMAFHISQKFIELSPRQYLFTSVLVFPWDLRVPFRFSFQRTLKVKVSIESDSNVVTVTDFDRKVRF